MQKIVAEISKLEVMVRHLPDGRILETSSRKIGVFKREEPLMGVEDLSRFKREFIERTASWVFRENKQQESQAKDKKKPKLIKLIVNKITVI